MKLKSLFLLCQFLALTVLSVFSQNNPAVPENLKSIIKKNQSFGMKKYPISFWNYTNLKEHGKYMTEAAVEEWSEAGFTVPISSYFNAENKEEVSLMSKMLDWANKRDMKMIVADPRCAAPQAKDFNEKKFTDGVKAAVETFGKNPALFGFYLGDEPGVESKEVFFKCYKLQKSIAPNLHALGNLLPYFSWLLERAGATSWPEYLDEYYNKGNPDFYSYDCYVQMNPDNEGWNTYFENLRYYREAALRNGTPFWNTLLSVAHFNYRVPNYDEIRWQFNTTLASGANGILWFFYYMRTPVDNFRSSLVDENWERTPTYYNIRKVQKEFHRRYGDLFNKLVSTRVTYFGKVYGNGKYFTPDGIISSLSTQIVSECLPVNADRSLLVGEFTDINGRRYAMIVNNSMTESVYAGIEFPGKDVKIYTMNYDGKEVEGNGGFSSDELKRTDKGLSTKQWLAPGQEVLYRVESESANKEPFK